MSTASLVKDAEVIAQAAHTISGAAEDFDRLLTRAGKAELVLIGEASHGTHEFYETRATLTKRLINEHGFGAVVCEADWPDSFRVHRYVTGRSKDSNATAALGDFRRFPAWMWRNTVIVDSVGMVAKVEPALRQRGKALRVEVSCRLASQ